MDTRASQYERKERQLVYDLAGEMREGAFNAMRVHGRYCEIVGAFTQMSDAIAGDVTALHGYDARKMTCLSSVVDPVAPQRSNGRSVFPQRRRGPGEQRGAAAEGDRQGVGSAPVTAAESRKQQACPHERLQVRV